jgi:hypothetical protein
MDSTPQILYYGEYESKDAVYQFTFSNYNVNAMVETDESKLPVETDYLVKDNNLEITFDLATQDTNMVDLYAYAHYYEDSENLMMGPRYIDTTEDIENQNPSNGGSTSGDGSSDNNTPGFELVILFSALFIIIILTYRNRR